MGFHQKRDYHINWCKFWLAYLFSFSVRFCLFLAVAVAMLIYPLSPQGNAELYHVRKDGCEDVRDEGYRGHFGTFYIAVGLYGYGEYRSAQELPEDLPDVSPDHAVDEYMHNFIFPGASSPSGGHIASVSVYRSRMDEYGKFPKSMFSSSWIFRNDDIDGYGYAYYYVYKVHTEIYDKYRLRDSDLDIQAMRVDLASYLGRYLGVGFYDIGRFLRMDSRKDDTAMGLLDHSGIYISVDPPEMEEFEYLSGHTLCRGSSKGLLKGPKE